MKRLIAFFIILSTVALFAQLPVGTTRTTVATDASGNVINTPLTFSQQVSMVTLATTPLHVVNFGQFTNVITAVTNIYPLATTKGGTGVATTQLPGSWTNTINFRVNGTNDANAYRVQGVLGITGSVSNLSATAGITNVEVFSSGILTNRFTIP